ncbi:signal transduction histidine kinase [Clostridium beijerinckii]|nr:signal transduction histidine kinase [Clostridium beijerinckii]
MIVDSVLGEGTKITIKLPIRHEEQEEVTQNE